MLTQPQKFMETDYPDLSQAQISFYMSSSTTHMATLFSS